jgi:hypothetical protein
MSRLFKAIAIRRFFANCKDRVIVNQAETSGRGTLHAHLAHAFYLQCGSWRGLLCTSTASLCAATARQTFPSMQLKRSWMSKRKPSSLVRRGSPVAVVVA